MVVIKSQWNVQAKVCKVTFKFHASCKNRSLFDIGTIVGTLALLSMDMY